MVRRTKEEAQETRNGILDAAERLFYDKGVSRTSLADIAHAAGVTRGAIYWHFANKGDLFTAMFDRVLLPLDELKAASVDPNEIDPLGRIREMCTLCLRNTATDARRRRVFDILFLKCEFVEEMGPVMTRHQSNMREGLGKLEEGLRNAISKHQLPADLDPARAARVVHSFIGGALRDMAILPDLFDVAAGAEAAVDALLDALRFSPALRNGNEAPTR
ncbi:TetR family transcriptional regulator [Paraburkholderia caballeronis]|uniref:Transcriptional regulator, TetR family n=1 Tax=Paraburkholderia caballeronis TaxID=416943 RepID=A0A1H7PR86_9BURK|nr:TetR family transcriptional regulator [Paraburkholderia caballeronis]PXW24303.1 TetR family transcriptional regulator [Paraburkholderia caballeronis]PXX00085.1 TetR family transcriptional regulator [Paraburkholderia caballeronis]RAJ97214.1 TetR family transcriptional regulator [Paraburkholderia caballeronis]TDV08352.1 TetR family transcriptional regulator [Paraburkholderia caballeronis]TDV12044.1 TetR family transcriptional regulator [Paraburkholderia caballeronis]